MPSFFQNPRITYLIMNTSPENKFVQSLSRVWLCNLMDSSTPGFPVHRQLTVCSNSCPLNRWCHPTISSSVDTSPPALNLSQQQGLFQCQLFPSGGQSIGASAHISPSNEYSGLIYLSTDRSPCCPRDFQESSPAPQFESINFSAQPCL